MIRSAITFLSLFWFISVTAYLDRIEYFDKVNMNLSWTIDTQTNEIFIQITAPSFIMQNDNSWIAFGISDNGGMKGADIGLYSLYHDKIYDLHSNDFVLPLMDKIQNWKLQKSEISDEEFSSIEI